MPLKEASLLSYGARVLLFVFSVALCLGAAEVVSRAYWRLFYGVSVRDPGMILYAYYPEMWHVWNKKPAHDDDFFDILLLGGSALHPDWGSVEQQLMERLARSGHRNVRTFNLAVPAHTSRDSWLKYAALSDYRFELVMFYHAANEARTNNAPPEVFREDYSHYWWYEILNTLAPYHGSASFSLPYTYHFLGVRAKQSIFPDHYILDKGAPREEWVEYGGNHRSVASFESNLRSIVDEASSRGDGMLLMTYAIYVPEDYSLEKFKEKRLDYVLHLSPLEIFGRPEFVIATVAAHNEVVYRMAVENEGALFVDQARLMGNSSDSFNDPFHFTTTGCSNFVENLVEALLPRLSRAY